MTEPSNGHFFTSNRRYLRNFLNLNLNNHLYKPFKVLGYPELWVHIDTIYLLPCQARCQLVSVTFALFYGVLIPQKNAQEALRKSKERLRSERTLAKLL
jgi:hypothetical protein